MPFSSLPKIVGRYRIVEEIGRGAMGRVYRALDPHTDRTVALKLFDVADDQSPEQLAQARARFLREARAAGRLAHPGIVAVYDADVDAATGAPFLAMELVAGRSLAELLQERGLLPWREAVATVVAIGEALDHAHARGVVHRDLKPANVLIAEDGAVKVSDFGVAKLAGESSTLGGTVRGTPNYMAPEQIRGGEVDGRADLYSLGAVLYQMLTGEAPFQAETVVGVAHQVVHDDPRSPSFACPDLPLELEHVLLRAMAKSVDDRFASGSDLAEALRAVIESEDGLATEEADAGARPAERKAPAPVSPQGQRRSRRKALGFTAFAALLAAALLVSLWLGRQKGPTDGSSEPAVRQPAVPDSPAVPTTGEPGGASVAADSAPPALDPPDEPGSPSPTRSQAAVSPAALSGAAEGAAPPAAPGVERTAPAAAAPAAAPSSSVASPRAKPTSASDPPPSPLQTPTEPTSTRTAAPAAEEPPATVEIHFVNRIKQGSLTVWIDGEPIWSTALESPKNPLRRLGGEELIGFIPIPAGQHVIEVRVVNASERIDARESETIDLSSGQTRVLRIGLQALRSKLRLKWEP